MSYVAGALSPWQLTEGSRAPRPGEVVVDQGSADAGDLDVGDTVTVLTQTGPHEFTLVGTARFGSVDSPGGASVAIFDLATAQQVLLGGTDEIDAVMVDASRASREDELTTRVAAALPAGIEALTGTQITEETQDDDAGGLSFFNTFLLVFAAIGLVVACFTIYNTFQIIVTQRRREMALLRSVGATRRQVLWAQLLEAVIIGVTASVIGLLAGVVVAGGLKQMMEGFGIDIPAGGTVFAGPHRGRGDGRRDRRHHRLRRLPVAARLAGAAARRDPRQCVDRPGPAGAAPAGTGRGAHGARRRGLRRRARPAPASCGSASAPCSIVRRGVHARTAHRPPGGTGPRRAAARGRWRHRGARPRERDAQPQAHRPHRRRPDGRRRPRGGDHGHRGDGQGLDPRLFGDQFTGDYVVSTDTFGFGGLSPDVADRLNELPEVAAAAGIRVGAARDISGGGGDTGYVAVDPATAGDVFDIGMIEGSIEALDTRRDPGRRRRGRRPAPRRRRHDRVRVRERHHPAPSPSRASTREDDLAGPFVVSHALHEQTGADQFDFSVYVATAPGVDDADAEAAIAAVSDDYPNADLQSRSRVHRGPGGAGRPDRQPDVRPARAGHR